MFHIRYKNASEIDAFRLVSVINTMPFNHVTVFYPLSKIFRSFKNSIFDQISGNVCEWKKHLISLQLGLNNHGTRWHFSAKKHEQNFRTSRTCMQETFMTPQEIYFSIFWWWNWKLGMSLDIILQKNSKSLFGGFHSSYHDC